VPPLKNLRRSLFVVIAVTLVITFISCEDVVDTVDVNASNAVRSSVGINRWVSGKQTAAIIFHDIDSIPRGPGLETISIDGLSGGRFNINTQEGRVFLQVDIEHLAVVAEGKILWFEKEESRVVDCANGCPVTVIRDVGEIIPVLHRFLREWHVNIAVEEAGIGKTIESKLGERECQD
jgi:hypothetical protein